MTPADLVGGIDAVARSAPDRVAQRSGGRCLTYGELRARSDALAAHIAGRLRGDGSPVALIGHKEPEMLTGFLAALKAGHPYLPLDSSAPPARIAAILASSGSRMTIAAADCGRFVESLRQARAPAPVACRPAYVMYTSGSTGVPKGVVIAVASLAGFVAWMVAEQAFTADEVFLDQAPYSFDLSVMSIYPALAVGAAIHSVGRGEVANPLALLDTLAASGITTWVSTPSLARLCLGDRRFAAPLLPRLRRFLFCGETLPPGVAGALLDRFPASDVWNTYGPTEATVATTSLRIDRQVLTRCTALPVGRPMPGVRIAILGEGDRPCPDGRAGEIVIAGPNVSAGYLGRPDLDAAAFTELDGVRAYRTGDIGSLQGGLLFVDGRRDDQVKLFGHRIELGDIEANLCAIPGVCAASVVKDERRERLVAFVLPAAAAPATEAASLAERVRAALAERVPAYMVPSRVELVDGFPLTANGKVDRRALAARRE